MNDNEKIITADKKPDYAQEIIAIIRGDDSPKVKLIRLEDYHENDIAEVISELTVQERKKFYHVCPAGMLAKIFEYFDEDEIGSRMSTNFVVIRENLTIKQAMNELVRQAEENDNITTLFVEDETGEFYGAIDLKELIIARSAVPLESLIATSFPRNMYVKLSFEVS